MVYLVVFSYKPLSYKKKRVLQIRGTSTFLEKLDPGTIDISQLFATKIKTKVYEINSPWGSYNLTINTTITKGSTEWEIPNRQWLKDNGWIRPHADDGAPMFVKSIQLYAPYIYNQEHGQSYYVTTSFKVRSSLSSFYGSRIHTCLINFISTNNFLL